MPKVDYRFAPVREEWDRWWSLSAVEQGIVGLAGYPRLLSLIQKHVPIEGTILEGGCGLGRFVIYLRAKGCDVIGVDYCTNAVEAAKRFDSALPLGVANVLNLPFESNSFDAYLSLGVLEHYEEGPSKGLQEAYRVLRPNGLLFIVGPYYNLFERLYLPGRVKQYLAGLNFVRKMFRKPELSPKQFWQYRFSPAEIVDYLELSNFKVNHVAPWGQWVILWEFIPSLRSQNTWRLESTIRAYEGLGNVERFNTVGKKVDAFLQRWMPWVCAHAWCAVARKK
jgi:SAM-dependent methyltransferase